jgi:GT2 family glycosyltransferase
VERIEAAGEILSVTEPAAPAGRRAHASAPVCSVVIPTYNGRALVKRCVESVARHRPSDPRLTIEVVVADDASSDGTAQWLGSAHPEIRVVCLERNGGFCAAANAGIAAARGRFIQVLNNDTEVAPGWIEAGLAPFADATVGSVAPLVLVRSQPGRVDSAGDSYALAGWPVKRGHGQRAELFASRPLEEVFGASGSSAFYRAEALRKAGAFDPLFGSYYEDVDLAFRLRWAGYRCLFACRCLVYHDISATYDHSSASLQRRMARNAEIVFWANLPAPLLATALVPHLALLAAQGFWRLARGQLHPFLLGKCDAIRAWSDIKTRRRLRGGLARTALSPPHFALGATALQNVRNHLTRPVEESSTARSSAAKQHEIRNPESER